MSARINIKGDTYGRLFVLRFHSLNKHNKTMWECRCECGEKVIVSSNALRRGNTKSCGCHNTEVRKSKMTRHGCSRTRLYEAWSSMKKRCNNPKDKFYKDYGGRGIGVCNEWNDFINFKEWAEENGYKDTLTIDRKNNNEGYYPENCRWVTSKVQSRNKTNSKIITYNNITMSVADWAEKTGINSYTLYSRLRANWSEERALTTPPKKQGACEL